MARTSLGSKALSVLLAVGLVASLNVPVSAWAADDDATGTAAIEQSLDPAGEGESENADAGTAVSDASQAVENQSDEAEAGNVTVNDSDSLKAAIVAAKDGDTITLGAGEFTTYGNASPKKSLTFVGAGPNTVWSIGNLNGTADGEGNGDYSFDGCDTIAFKNMTLKSDAADYRGFIRINNTVVDNCTLVGKTAYWGYNTAKFSNSTFNSPEGDYALWDYSTKEMSFDNCTFNISGKGVNVYVEAGNAGEATRTVAVNNCTVNSTKANKAFLNIKNKTQAYDVVLSGTNAVTGLAVDGTTDSALFQVETTEVTETSGKPVTVKEKAEGGAEKTLYEVKAATSAVAEVNGTKYDTLQAAIDAAKSGATVTLLADTRENVTVSNNAIVLDLNGHTLNGGTENAKPALTVNNKKVTLQDSSEAQTGTIKREDTEDTKTSYYVIDIQGKSGFMVVESGNVENNSGIPGVKGSSLIRLGNDSVSAWPTLTIKGGTFTQNNFIAIKVDRGTLHLLGGTVNSANSYAVENWNNAYIKGGTVNGTVSTWVYSTGAAFSKLEISGGTVNGNVASVNYDNAADKQARVFITGGTVTGTLGTYTYSNSLVPTEETSMATIEVTGGTFDIDPTKYVVEDAAVNKNDDGTFGVEKAYLAKVGETSYYTMDEAFHAAVASGETLYLLRDYTTGAVQNSGSKSFTIDLNDHTWTYTGTDTDCAAFEINYSDVMLTVKNGTVVSNSMVGLIPTAMSGTITYNNAGLVFEDVKMTANGHSGIETNGGNTNDTVKLVNSTLNVPNGYGIYFPSSGTLTIDNSKVTAKTMGVQICAGDLSVTGADTAVTVAGDGVAKTENDGAIQDGAAISIVNRTGYKGLGQIAITGGTFTANGDNAAVKAYKWENMTASAFDNSANVVAVSGGTFSSAVDKSLCADGYIPTDNGDGTYGVKEGADGYVEDESGNVTISTAEGLFYFAKKVNAGDNFAGKTVTLASDIDLEDEQWTPIGIYGDSATHFKGTFDGQDHAVTGLKVAESNKNGVGFFGKVFTGTIKNLTVEGSVSAPGCTYVGGIVGHGYATITNCTFKGTVGGVNAAQVGGIAGSGGFTVDRCSVYGDVSAGCWAGGIVANAQDGGAYTNCYVEGTISSDNTNWGGGAAGIMTMPLYPSQVISGCYSNTVVKVAGEEVNCPIIAAYNNPLDYNGYSGGLKIYDNSWNKQKNSNDSYPIYAEKDGNGGVLMEGMTAARDNSLIMLADDLNYVTGDLSKVRIMAGSSVTQAEIDALAVASVGDSKYQSLTEAVAAAEDGETVTLLSDAAEDVAISKSITLDLDGKTLTNTNAGKATISVKGGTVAVKNGNVVGGTGYYNIEVTKNSANLTLTDVSATAGNTGSSMIDNWGTLTIESGSYAGGLNVVKSEEGSTLTIDGGKFELSYAVSNSYTGVIFAYGNTTITGGEFVCNATGPYKAHPQCVATGVVDGYTSFTKITGGTFTNNFSDVAGSNIFRGIGKATSANFEVTGGTFNKKVSDGYFADGYTCVKNSDGTYGIATAIAQVGSTRYTSLQAAIKAMKNGKTVQLLTDTTENVTIAANKKITLDLNGHTLNGSTGTANAAILNKGNVTITDTSADKTGTIKRDDQGAEGETSYYVIDNNGTMVIDQANVTNNSGSKGSSLIRNGGVDNVSSLTINGGMFKQQNFIAVKNDGNGELTINGGTLTSKQSVVQNWNKAQILGGNLTGIIWTDSWTEAGTVGETVIGGDAHFTGKIRMDVTSPNPSTLKIEGGSLDVTSWTVTDAAAKVDSSIAVSGGTFTAAVPEDYCATGYVPVTNGDGTYSVEEGKFTVQVTSRTTTSDSPVANVSGGGSDITYADGTTVTASAISGYNFVGWFVNDYSGTPYSTDLTCTVKPTDNCTMIAVYEPVSGGKFWLTVTASEFTVNGGAVQDSYLYEQYAIGASVTVNFTGTENFLYWVNASNKVVSTDKSYTFTMGSETALKAVYGKARQNQATVVFISHSDQIISSKAYTTSDTIQFPVPPIKMGCTFTGWSMTESEIREAMANNNGIIQVRALYTEPSVDCKVTVIYPDGTGNEVVNTKVGQLVNVTAKDIEGKTFSYWTDNDGNVLGYTKTLKLAPSGDMTVNAIYSDGATEAKPVISMTAVDANAGNGYYLISFTATRAVPEGYELVKQGVLYSIDSRCAGDAGKDYLKLTADGTVPEGVYEYSGGNNDPNGVTRFNGKVRTADTTLYGRGYMILKNSAGEVLYVYSDTILSGSYNSLKK